MECLLLLHIQPPPTYIWGAFYVANWLPNLCYSENIHKSKHFYKSVSLCWYLRGRIMCLESHESSFTISDILVKINHRKFFSYFSWLCQTTFAIMAQVISRICSIERPILLENLHWVKNCCKYFQCLHWQLKLIHLPLTSCFLFAHFLRIYK